MSGLECSGKLVRSPAVPVSMISRTHRNPPSLLLICPPLVVIPYPLLASVSNPKSSTTVPTSTTPKSSRATRQQSAGDIEPPARESVCQDASFPLSLPQSASRSVRRERGASLDASDIGAFPTVERGADRWRALGFVAIRVTPGGRGEAPPSTTASPEA